MFLNSVTRSSVFNEFTPEEKKEYFSIKEKAVSHHVDSLYYSVYLTGDVVNNEDSNLAAFLEDLEEYRNKKINNPRDEILFHDLLVSEKGAAVSSGLYAYHLSEAECFDIFISRYIPNKDTPRIQVQLRTRALILSGLYGAIEDSFSKLKCILSAYSLSVDSVMENRIDYAFHTNVLQKFSTMFSDESLSKHLITSFRDGSKHFWITNRTDDFLDLDYLSLGNRRSNKVFFRIYEKTKEVVQMQYKSFFIQRWYQRGLISAYDRYVLEYAYSINSYRTGLLVGRCKWYIEHGKDPELKARLEDLLEKCNIKSDNNPFLEKSIAGILPPVTIILNIEFETKRKYYVGLDNVLDTFSLMDEKSFTYNYLIPHFEREQRSPELTRLYKILMLRREIIDNLTSEKVLFVENRCPDDADGASFYDDRYLDWWKRIRRVRIEDQPDQSQLEDLFHYSYRVDSSRSEQIFLKSLSSAGITLRNSSDDATFAEDLWEVITHLNDNDLKDSDRADLRRMFSGISLEKYRDVQKRKSRQMKSIIKQRKERDQHSDELLEKRMRELDEKGYIDHKEPPSYDVDFSAKPKPREERKITCTVCGRTLPIYEFPIYKQDHGECRSCLQAQREPTQLTVFTV